MMFEKNTSQNRWLACIMLRGLVWVDRDYCCNKLDDVLVAAKQL
jgi:hypothetical protein